MQDYRDDYYEARLAQIERKRRCTRFWGILSIVVPIIVFVVVPLIWYYTG